MHLVIVGGVAAGAKAAARARRVNSGLAITIFQDEDEVSYSACGQPYFLSGLVPSRETLIVRRVSDFKTEEINVRLKHRVTHLNTQEHTIKVHALERNAIEEVSYDRLILATGARPVIPSIPGNHLEGIVMLRKMVELDRFQSTLDRLQPKQAVIIGGGYIALEVAETLRALGIAVTLVGRNGQLFSKLDPEMSQRVHDHLAAQGVRLVLGDQISKIIEEAGRVAAVITAAGHRLPAGLVVLAMGIRPNVELAAQGGVALGATGAIAVDSRMETNVKGVFAAGDCAESRHRLTGMPVWTPLGDIANLQGRVAGENAGGGDVQFPGVLGTSIVKTFELNIGLTGLTESAARQSGFNPIAAVITTRDKARYFPGAREVTLKLVADSRQDRLLGAQAVGPGAVDKMIDIAATALLGNLGCRDLEYADLAYAPPFSPVLSPVIVAASALVKKLESSTLRGA